MLVCETWGERGITESFIRVTGSDGSDRKGNLEAYGDVLEDHTGFLDAGQRDENSDGTSAQALVLVAR